MAEQISEQEARDFAAQAREPKLPSRLSPSRAQDYLKCPKSFWYKVCLKLPDPPGVEAARGTVAHSVLEELFKLDRDERTEDWAVDRVIDEWNKLAEENDDYRQMAPEGSEDEQGLIEFAEQMVRNYFKMEDPTRFDPTGLETYLKADVGGGLVLHGYIDRLDEHNDRTYVSDYKTGKTKHVVRYWDKSFFAMHVYALLVYEQTGKIPHELRLVYLQGANPKHIYREKVDLDKIEQTRQKMIALWRAIKNAFHNDPGDGSAFPTKTGPLCNWCAYQSICPAFAPAAISGIVSEVLEASGDEQYGDVADPDVA